ncbi:MAG: hypothetical protein JKY86_01225 [Gammaproteobacteria bacterium]|nr:hypothetical protein [Gammaproteobacteria bacterium]
MTISTTPPYADPRLGDRIAVVDGKDINAMIDMEPIALALGVELVVVTLKSPGWAKAKVCDGPHEGGMAILRYCEDNYRLVLRA